MRAMVLSAYQSVEENPLQLMDIPIPVPGPDEVRLRVQLCGACHTDLHTVEGDILAPKMPVIPGHQVVGVVDAIGKDVRGIEVGARIGVPWLYDACGKCAYCMAGDENLCPSARFTGFHVDGGYAEFVLVRASYALPLPAQLSNEQAAPFLCAGIIGYRSLRKADLHPGERLGLVGFGASAHLAIQVARHWGCDVYVFTRSPEHRRHAEALGAVWVGGADDQPPVQLDRAVIFAPAGKLVPKMMAKLRPGGTLAINAIHMSPIPPMPYRLIYGERTLRSVTNATYRDGLEFLKLALEIPIRPTVQLYDLDDANQALVDIKHSRLNGEAVLRI